MAKVTFGNHAAVRVPRAERDRIRGFYRDVLGGEITREGDQKDDVRIGDDFYIAFLYEDETATLDASGFLNAMYLELKADFQAPGGQVLRLVGLGEDLSRYEGTEHGEQFVGRQFATGQ